MADSITPPWNYLEDSVHNHVFLSIRLLHYDALFIQKWTDSELVSVAK
jgi:hypothetical protein